MKAVFCTCNDTISYQDSVIQGLLSDGIDPVFTHAFCRDRDEVLEQFGTIEDGLFVGCGKENRHLRDALTGLDVQQDNIVAWDLKDLLASVPVKDVSRVACAYAEAASCLLENRRFVPSLTIPVGAKLVVAGPDISEVATHLSEYLDVIAVCTKMVDSGVDILCGTVAGVRGKLGDFEVLVDCQTPVDPQLCVNCNACVECCPQGALDEFYHLDEEKCDKCLECVKACSTIGAIDLDRKQMVLQADQVVMYQEDGVSRPGLYFPADQNDLFATGINALAFASEESVEASCSISYQPQKCVHGYAEIKGCQECIQVCPGNALVSDGNKIAVIHDLCIGCFACVSACPSGALSSLPFTHGAWGKALEKFVITLGDVLPVSITCQDCGEETIQGHAAFPLPKKALLDAGHLLAACNAGAKSVFLSPCSCQANANKSQLDCVQEVLKRADMSQYLALDTAGNEAVFSGINSFKDKADVDWRNKHASLVSLLKPFISETSGEFPPLDGPFGQIAINEKSCSGCGACVDACTVDALTSDDDNMTIMVQEANCIGCGLCKRVCPEKAVQVVPGLRWNLEVFTNVPMAKVEGVSCRKCDKVFATRKAVESVAARLQEKLGMQDLDHLEFCPDCRVVVALTEY